MLMQPYQDRSTEHFPIYTALIFFLKLRGAVTQKKGTKNGVKVLKIGGVDFCQNQPHTSNKDM